MKSSNNQKITKPTKEAVCYPKREAKSPIGRPTSSSDFTLIPHFKESVDIEALGKALIAIALKQSK